MSISISKLVSPRRGAGAGVGVGMLRGRGAFLSLKIESFKVSQLLGVLVSWLLDSKFLGFKVSRFQSFNDPIIPTFHFMFSGRY